MLKIISSTKVENSSLEIDHYIPLSFRCFEAASVTPIYWRTGDLRESLIELKLNIDNGAIFSVTTTLLPHFTESTSNKWDSGADIIEELPLCDTSHWSNEQFNDEKTANLIIHLIGNSISIWLNAHRKIKLFYKVNRLLFGVDDNNTLCLLRFDDLTESEITLINQRQ